MLDVVFQHINKKVKIFFILFETFFDALTYNQAYVSSHVEILDSLIVFIYTRIARKGGRSLV